MQEVAEVIELLWGGPETLIVISSDLSHYLPYGEAQHKDRAAAAPYPAAQPAGRIRAGLRRALPINGMIEVGIRSGSNRRGRGSRSRVRRVTTPDDIIVHGPSKAAAA